MSHVKTYARLAAIGWAIVPVAWSITVVLDRTSAWDDSPVQVYMIGALGLIGAGVFTMLVLSRIAVPRTRTGTWALVVGGLATLASVVSWALPLWMTLWAVAAVLAAVAASPARYPMTIFATSMALGVGAFAALTVLEVGTPDSYGDYPVAAVTSFIVATVGAVLAMLLASSRLPEAELLEIEAQPVG